MILSIEPMTTKRCDRLQTVYSMSGAQSALACSESQYTESLPEAT